MGRRRQDRRGPGRYVFGLLPSDDELTLEVRDFAGCCPIEPLRVAGLCALTARVPDEVRDAVAIPGEPGRLVELVGQHDRVLRAAAATGSPLVPMPFGLLLDSREALHRRIEERCVEIFDAFQRLDGCDEWGVHVSAPRRAPQRAVRSVAAHVYDRLAVAAEDAVIEPIAARAREERPSVLSASFLVNRDRRRLFDRTLADLDDSWAGIGATVQTSGPWPSYHFARVDLGAPACPEARVLLGPLGAPERAWTSTAPQASAGGAVMLGW